MTTLHLPPATSHIHIYTDGSCLLPGKQNPLTAGGGGIVIVKDGRKRSFSIASEGENSNICEYDAIAHALKAVHEQEWKDSPTASVTLHTDQNQLVKAFAPMVHGVPTPAIPRDFPAEAKRLMKEMRVNVRFLRERTLKKDSGERTICFNEAHELASLASWSARLEKQGYVHYYGQGRLQGDDAKAYLARIKERIATPARGI